MAAHDQKSEHEAVSDVLGHGRPALVTPRHGQAGPVTLELLHDWPAFVAGGGQGTPPQARPTVTTFVPPAYAAVPDRALFATLHLACARAGASLGQALVEAPAPAPG